MLRLLMLSYYIGLNIISITNVVLEENSTSRSKPVEERASSKKSVFSHKY